MPYEIETKVLDVDKTKVIEKMNSIGAKKILETKFSVDWFRPRGTKEGKDPWYLRIRTFSDGKAELTWKSLPKLSGITRKSKEININIDSPEKMKEILEILGLELYAHQEKERISWIHKKWRFDLDQYPGMPAYLEIEGNDEKHNKEAIKLLSLEANKAISEGERILIQKEYGLDWYDMRF